MIITHKLKMSLEEAGTPQRLEMPLGDISARQINLLLYSRQKPWTIPENVTVLIRYKKPDGTVGEYDTMPDGTAAWSAEGNALSLSVAPQVLTAVGVVQMYAALYLEDKVLHTFTVEIAVKAPFVSYLGGADLGSQDYYYVTHILRGPVAAQTGDVLLAGGVDDYGHVTEVHAKNLETLVNENFDLVLSSPQTLDDHQKWQARKNIDAQERLTRSNLSAETYLVGTEENFSAFNGLLYWECCDRQDWVSEFKKYSFVCTVEVDGQLYTIDRSDCDAVDASYNGNQRWLFRAQAIPELGTLVWVGNGMNPISGQTNDKLCIGCAADRVISFEIYALGAEVVSASPVMSVNGLLPDWNGNVLLPKEKTVKYAAQTLSDAQKAQARSNIAAAPGGYGWGESQAAAIPNDDANNAVITGMYRASSTAVNVPSNCKMVFVQAASSGYIFQTAYCEDGSAAMRICDHDDWSAWNWINKKKVYERIATITVTADENGVLPQYVTFEANSDGKAFALTDFMVRAYAGFADGAQSTLYMNVNNDSVIVNGTIPSISTSCRYFNVFFRREADGCKRVEYTTSMLSEQLYNAQATISNLRLIPPMSAVANAPITKIDIFTQTGTTKAWVEGSTFELWGVRE